MTKLDRLARSLPDARAIAEDLTKRKVRLSLGASIYDPTDPVGRLLFNVLAMVAEFEADLIRSRTREGMRVAKVKGHLRGKQPKLNPRQGAPGRTAPQRRVLHRRARRPLRRRPLYRLSRCRTQQALENQWSRARTVTPGQGARNSGLRHLPEEHRAGAHAAGPAPGDGSAFGR